MKTKLILALACSCVALGNLNQAYGVGANTPFTSVEAENGTLAGGATVKNLQNSPPAAGLSSATLEASGGGYAHLSGTGQSLTVTNSTGGNITALNVRFSIPDSTGGGGLTGTLDMYVNGTFRQTITLSSAQSWCYESGINANGGAETPSSGFPHDFWDEMHFFITGAAVANGSTITFQKNSGNTAAFYDLDVIDMENPPAALGQPANSLSIITYGAVANNPSVNNTTSIINCINACQSQGKIMWIPAGTFYCAGTSTFHPTGITIQGAGMWYSSIYNNPTNAGGSSTFDAISCTMQDFMLAGNAADGPTTCTGINMKGSNWVINRLWMEHRAPGVWADGTHGILENCRIDTGWSDGININNGNNETGNFLTVSNCFIRGSGDDGIAINSSGGQLMTNATVVSCTSIAPRWANNIGIYGGQGILVSNCLCDESVSEFGISVGSFGSGGEPFLSGTVANNTINRGGCYSSRHALQVGQTESITNATIIGNIINNPQYEGLSLNLCGPNMVVKNNTVNNPGTTGFSIESGAVGSALIESNIVGGALSGQSDYADSSTGFTATEINNSWQSVSQDQPVAASSVDGVNISDNGNDGDLTTRWAASTGTFPQWWAVDLGGSYVLRNANIYWYNAASRYYQYKIQVSSDATNYTTVVDKSANTTMGNTTDYFSATNRYVRIYVTGASAGYASLYECLVFPSPSVLLSQGHSATDSSDDGVNIASNGNDGNTTTTRWAASTGSFPQTWTVDLGASHTVHSTTVDWYNSSSRYYQYQIQVSSDGVNFTTVVDKSGNTTDGNTTDNFSATGRYVRINVTGSSTGYASFYECQVFGN